MQITWPEELPEGLDWECFSDVPNFPKYTTESLMKYGDAAFFGGGKHQGRSYMEIAVNDSQYMMWLSQQPYDGSQPLGEFKLAANWWCTFNERNVVLPPVEA